MKNGKKKVNWTETIREDFARFDTTTTSKRRQSQEAFHLTKKLSHVVSPPRILIRAFALVAKSARRGSRASDEEEKKISRRAKRDARNAASAILQRTAKRGLWYRDILHRYRVCPVNSPKDVKIIIMWRI